MGKLDTPGQLQILGETIHSVLMQVQTKLSFKLLLKYERQVQLRKKKKPNSVISGINDFNYDRIKHACK